MGEHFMPAQEKAELRTRYRGAKPKQAKLTPYGNSQVWVFLRQTGYTELPSILVLKQMATEDVIYSERPTGANREIPRQHSLSSHSRPLGFPDRELALWRNSVE